MRKAGKILVYTLGALLVLAVAGITFTVGWRPFIGPRARAASDRVYERTPERLARGRYLVTAIAGCETCHSPKDWKTHGAPIIPGMELAGQVITLPGLPRQLVVPNLTPDPATGSGHWTDGEIARAIREGIGHDGRALFPVMPYTTYRELSDEDTAAIVVYLRSLPPVHNPLPPTRLDFPLNYLIRSVPRPLNAPVRAPDAHDRVKYGQYLATMGCGCHTPSDQHGDLPGMQYAGGDHLAGPWGDVTSANLTSDPTGIGYFDEAMFIKTLRTGYVGARELNSIMPFGEFQNLTDDDMKAIFAYLRSLPPVRHRVDNSLPPTYCKLCKQKHGAGDQN